MTDQGRIIGEMEVEESSPLERALAIYRDIAGNNMRFDVFKMMIELEKPLAAKELFSQTQDMEIPIPYSSLSKQLKDAVVDGLMVRDNQHRYSTTEHVNYVVQRVVELEELVLNNKFELSLDNQVRQKLITEEVLEEVETSLMIGYRSTALKQSLAIHNSITPPTRFAVLKAISVAEGSVKWQELLKIGMQKKMLPGATLSNTLHSFKISGMITGHARTAYELTSIGEYVIQSVTELEHMFVDKIINQRLNIARSGGASEQALGIYESALRETK